MDLAYPRGPDPSCTAANASEAAARGLQPDEYFGVFADPSCALITSPSSALLFPFYCITACTVIATLIFALSRHIRALHSSPLRPTPFKRARGQIDPTGGQQIGGLDEIEIVEEGKTSLVEDGSLNSETHQTAEASSSFFIEFGDGLHARYYRQEWSGKFALSLLGGLTQPFILDYNECSHAYVTQLFSQ
eukprot:464080-Pleurochrysis_carterae.AAC.3